MWLSHGVGSGNFLALSLGGLFQWRGSDVLGLYTGPGEKPLRAATVPCGVNHNCTCCAEQMQEILILSAPHQFLAIHHQLLTAGLKSPHGTIPWVGSLLSKVLLFSFLAKVWLCFAFWTATPFPAFVSRSSQLQLVLMLPVTGVWITQNM